MYESRRWSHPLQIFASASDPPAGCGACGSPVFPHRHGPSLSAAPLPSLPTCPPFSSPECFETNPSSPFIPPRPVAGQQPRRPEGAQPAWDSPPCIGMSSTHTHTLHTPTGRVSLSKRRSRLCLSADPTTACPSHACLHRTGPARPNTCIFNLLALPLVNGGIVGVGAPRCYMGRLGVGPDACWGTWYAAWAPAVVQTFRWISISKRSLSSSTVSRPEPWWPCAMLCQHIHHDVPLNRSCQQSLTILDV